MLWCFITLLQSNITAERPLPLSEVMCLAGFPKVKSRVMTFLARPFKDLGYRPVIILSPLQPYYIRVYKT